MIQLVLFDIDGTLIRTGGAGQVAFDRVAETMFHVPNGTRHLNFAGRTDTSIVRDFFKEQGIPPTPANFARFFDSYVFWLDQLLHEYAGKVLPGVRQIIRDFQALPQPPVIGLLTGNIRLGAQIKLQHYRLWDEFEMGAFGDDHEERNRLAVIARERGGRICQRPLRGEEMLVVGDTPKDIECGRAIAARVLAVATGGAAYEELERHQPDWLVRSLDQVAVTELNGQPA